MNKITKSSGCVFNDLDIDSPRTIPAPCDELVTIGYVHRGTAGLLMEGAVSEAVIIPKAGGDFKHAVVFSENAEEVIAAKDARIKELEKLCNDTEAEALGYASDKAELEADNASLIHDLNRIKDHETELINDNAAKDAQLERLADDYQGKCDEISRGWKEFKALEADNKRLREALDMSEAAISEFYRYWTGGEMRGSYDGKPERDGLWKAMYKARAALGEVKP